MNWSRPGRTSRHALPRLATLLVAVVAPATACSDDGSMAAFCATARAFAVDNPAAVFDRYDPGDPTSAVALLRDAGHRLRAWADEAPGGIDDDVDRIAEATDELAVSFEQPDTDGGSEERTAELAASFAEVEAASVRVTAYTRENCEVDLDPAAPPVTPATEPTTTTAAP